MRRYVFFFPVRFVSCSTWRRCLPGQSGYNQACLFVRLTVVQLNLKPEAPLSALLPTNNEIGRDSWEDVSTIELRGVLSTSEIKNTHFSDSKPTNWNVMSSYVSSAVFKSTSLFPALSKNTPEGIENSILLYTSKFSAFSNAISWVHSHLNSFMLYISSLKFLLTISQVV